MKKMRKNDAVELEITAVTNLGAGVGRTDDGIVVFVPGAVTGERVRATVIKVNQTFCIGRLTETLTTSPLRAGEDEQICRAPATCGGCAYRFITGEHELELKRRNVLAEFEKAGLPEAEVLPVLAVRKDGKPVEWRYRNKAQYRFTQTKNGVRAGFYAAGTHRVAGDESCPLQPVIFGEIASFVCRYADANRLSVYDEESGKGLLRHLYLRGGAGENAEIGVCLVVNAEKLPGAAQFAAALTARFPRVVSVTVNENRSKSNVILGEKYSTVFGKPTITDRFCGLDFEISPAAFYQVNHDAAELLVRTAADMADLYGDERLLDLYCGIGTVGLSISAISPVSELIGVEIVPQAVECARRNAEKNGVANARFLCADSGEGAAKLLSDPACAPDVVVVDPPRKGCSADLLETLDACPTRKILYISCDPATLARDCAILHSRGWSLSAVQPVNLFPRTGHVETVVLMSRDKE